MASRMDEDDPSEYCRRLRQVDAEQFIIEGKIVKLEGELRALGIYCHMEKGERSTYVRVHKYNSPSAIKVAMVTEELIFTDSYQTVVSNHIEVINSEKIIGHSTSRDVIMEDDDVITYKEDECWVEKDRSLEKFHDLLKDISREVQEFDQRFQQNKFKRKVLLEGVNEDDTNKIKSDPNSGGKVLAGKVLSETSVSEVK